MVAINPRLDGHKNIERLLEEGIEVVAGGFPCQDISAAGKGAGLSGERSGLWRALLRTIRLVRPKIAIVENVAALLYRGMGTVLGDLARSGYDTEWHCISAADAGAPHLRKRIWIVAYPDNTGCIEQRWPLAIRKKLASLKYSGESRGDATSAGLPNWAGGAMGQPSPLTEFERPSGREIERDFCGMAHGVSNRVDRLTGLGNAVVPQIPEIIGQAIKEKEGEA